MVISQGDVVWADLPEPEGSGPGFRRPVVVVQGDALNQSRIGTVICVPLTSNLKWADAPGNVLLKAKATGLPKDSVANVSQIIALDRAVFDARAGTSPRANWVWCWRGSTSSWAGETRAGRMGTRQQAAVRSQEIVLRFLQ